MNRLKSRLMALLAGIVLLSLVLAGCSGDNESGEASSGDGGTELTMLISETADTPGFRAVVAAIEEEHGIETKVEKRPGGPEGENVVKTRLATDDMADMVLFNSGSLLMALNPAQHFVDVKDESFMEPVMDSYKEVVSDEGQVFGIPAKSSQVGGWLYNTRVYEELGLSVPKTWDELMANNEKIKEAGKTAVIGTYGETWTSQLPILADYYNVQAAVPEFAEEYTAGNAKYSTTPEALRGFKRIEEIGEKGYMNEDYTVATYDQGMQMLAEGTGVHYPMLTQVLPIIAENYGEKVNDIGVFPQPSDTPEVNGLTAWMPDVIMINKNIESEKIEAAKKWMEFFISEEGLEIYEAESKSIGPYVIEGVELPEDSYPAVKEMATYFEAGNVAPALEFVSPIKGPNLPQISTSVGSGTMTAEEAAAMYDEDVEKQAKQLGLDW